MRKISRAISLPNLLRVRCREKLMRSVSSSVFEGKASVHQIRAWFQNVAGIEPGVLRNSTAAGLRMEVLFEIGAVLLVEKANRVEKFVMSTAILDAPVGQAKSLPTWFHLWVVR